MLLFSNVNPMLLELSFEPFDDENFIFEPKWDGWRILLHKEGSRIEAFTRNGNIVTTKFPELAEVGSSIRAHTAILDCEGICLRGGRPVFDDFAFRGRLTDSAKIKKAMATHPATFVAFDVLQTDREHIGEPLMERKSRLGELIEDSATLTKTMYIEGQGKALKKLSEQQDLEGIVAKRKKSKYHRGVRSSDWQKIKNWKSIDCMILGYRLNPTFGLVLGLNFKTMKEKPIGTVGLGIKPEEKKAFLEIAKTMPTRVDKGTHWLEPKLCCRVDYLERTDTHHLRHLTFRGFLFDKRPEDCVWHS